MDQHREGHPEGDQSSIPTGEPRVGDLTQGHPAVESGLPSLTPLAGIMFVRCCVCKVALPSKPVPAGDLADGMTSDGYCETHAAAFLAEAQAVVNPHLDTEDHEEPEELLPARPSDEFASRQTPDGGW